MVVVWSTLASAVLESGMVSGATSRSQIIACVDQADDGPSTYETTEGNESATSVGPTPPGG